MEAVEKDFQDLVTSEEEPTTAVTTDVEDEIIQQILTSEDEVEETAKVEETKDLEEEGILDDDEIESLSEEEFAAGSLIVPHVVASGENEINNFRGVISFTLIRKS